MGFWPAAPRCLSWPLRREEGSESRIGGSCSWHLGLFAVTLMDLSRDFEASHLEQSLFSFAPSGPRGDNFLQERRMLRAFTDLLKTCRCRLSSQYICKDCCSHKRGAKDRRFLDSKHWINLLATPFGAIAKEGFDVECGNDGAA